MHLRSIGVLGILLAIFGLGILFLGAAMWTAGMPQWHPRAVKPGGLSALEVTEDREHQGILDDIRPPRIESRLPTEPPVDPNAPKPADTKLYNNLLDNLLSSLHYYYQVPDDAPPTQFVASWDADTGARVLGDALWVSLEANLDYLLTLEIYRRLHAKAVFDQDLVFARKRVEGIFAQDWHTGIEWPLSPYFDLVQLYDLTGDEQYLQWAERYALGDGPQDSNSPLSMAKGLAFKFQYSLARVGSPIYFLYAALLADYGKRRDPAMINQARFMFEGLRDLLLDRRYNLLMKQVSVPSDGSSVRNLTQTFDTLEQVTAIRAVIAYGQASGDPEATSLAKAVMSGIWGTNSILLVKPPEDMPPTTFYGVYTAYDLGREAMRMDPNMKTIDQILLFETEVLLNGATRGEYRGDVDFLASWLEDSGPLYKPYLNGYFATYGDNWADPEDKIISARAAIWMARGLAEDEWHKYRTAQAVSGQLARPEAH